MLKLVCDICGREIKTDEDDFGIILYKKDEPFINRKEYDLCLDCYKEIEKEVNSENV